MIKDFYRTILESAGGRALVLGCNAIPHLGVGYMHANRTGDDTSGRHFDLVRKNGFNALAFRLMQNRTFYAADADCAGFVPGRIPWEENRQWVTMLAGSGSPPLFRNRRSPAWSRRWSKRPEGHR